jgi:hypothetical protein
MQNFHIRLVSNLQLKQKKSGTLRCHNFCNNVGSFSLLFAFNN